MDLKAGNLEQLFWSFKALWAWHSYYRCLISLDGKVPGYHVGGSGLVSGRILKYLRKRCCPCSNIWKWLDLRVLSEVYSLDNLSRELKEATYPFVISQLSNYSLRAFANVSNIYKIMWAAVADYQDPQNVFACKMTLKSTLESCYYFFIINRLCILQEIVKDSEVNVITPLSFKQCVPTTTRSKKFNCTKYRKSFCNSVKQLLIYLLEVDHKWRSSESYLVCYLNNFLATLLVVPVSYIHALNVGRSPSAFQLLG